MSGVDDELRKALAAAAAATSPAQALQLLDDARRREPRLEAAPMVHVARARCLSQLERDDEAVAAADAAVVLAPGVPDLATNLGGALLGRFRRRGDRADLTRAIRVLEDAAALGPRTPEVRSTLAVALEQAGRAADAVAVCVANLARFPGDPVTLFNQAAALRSLGQRDEARALLLALSSTFPPARAALDRL